jgi:hypothetical protein
MRRWFNTFAVTLTRAGEDDRMFPSQRGSGLSDRGGYTFLSFAWRFGSSSDFAAAPPLTLEFFGYTALDSTLGRCSTTEYTISLYYSQHGLTLCFSALLEHARRLLRRTFLNSAFARVALHCASRIPYIDTALHALELTLRR